MQTDLWYSLEPAMNSVPAVSFILCILAIIAGCNTSVNNSDAKENITPTPTSEFPVPPVALPARYYSGSTIGAFEDSFIGSYECSNGSESYGTNYTLFTSSGRSRSIHYTLVPVDNMDNLNEVPLPSDILNASITPDDFIAQPGYIYTSRVLITVGPDVTGESGSGWSRNPYFPFLLKVTVDGADASGADDQITIIKWCTLHSQTRNMQASPGWMQTPQSDIVIKAGSRQEVNLSVRNFGGGIRELYFKIPARINGSSWTCCLTTNSCYFHVMVSLLQIPAGPQAPRETDSMSCIGTLHAWGAVRFKSECQGIPAQPSKTYQGTGTSARAPLRGTA